MTAPVQLSNRHATRDSKVGPAVARPPLGATLTRSLPAPVLPLAPPARGNVVSSAHRQLRDTAVAGAEAALIQAPRPGRVVRLVTAAAVTLAVIGGLAWLGQAPGPGFPAETTVIQVGAGETMWDVAQRVAPKSDQRAVVERIRQLNGMVGLAIQPGQQLRVPAGQ
jgi:hypothetical protein